MTENIGYVTGWKCVNDNWFQGVDHSHPAWESNGLVLLKQHLLHLSPLSAVHSYCK